MATTYPVSLQDLDSTRGTANQALTSPNHVTHHALEDDTIEALQTKVGIDSSAVATSLDYLVKNTNSNAVTYSGNIKLTGNPQFTNGLYDTNGNEELKIVTTASAVNELQLTNAATANNPLLETTGGDTNIGLDISTKGTGTMTLWSGAKGRELLVLVNVASAVNQFQISPSATGANPILEATGGDTNIGLDITPKGTGKLRLTAGDYDLVAATANIQVAGADPVRGMYIPASGLTAATTNGAALGTIETTTNKVVAAVKDFDQTTQEFVALAIQSPIWWNASTITVQFIWTAASGTGAVVWAAQGVAFSDDDAMDTAYGTEQTATDTLITANDSHAAPVTAAITIAGTPVAGDLVCLRFKRNPADAGDTLNADARLIAVRVRWTMAQYDDQ